MKSPFKFLDAFTLKDSKFFFGREKEIDALYKMVFESPLILIYGLSGTGKTSLVQCGLASRFDGPDWFPFFIRRNENINDSLNKELDICIRKKKEMNLTEKISYLTTKYLRPVYLVFDQFEELFILGDEAEQNKFIADIKQLIDEKLHCKVIFIIREEYLGQLYHFENTIPYIFDFRLRVEPMSVKLATVVLDKSFSEFNITLEPPKEKRIQQIIGNVSGEKSGIQLPYMQVYLDMLYREDFHRTYPDGNNEEFPELEFTEDEIEKFGQIEDVLSSFLDDQKTELQQRLSTDYNVDKESVSDLLDALVTEEGTKRPFYFRRKNQNIDINPSYKKFLPNMPDEAIDSSIVFLEKKKILRFVDDNSFELAHDSLAKLIDQKRTNEQRQFNEIRKSLLTNFRDYDKTEQFLSEKQLNRYEPFILSLRLEDEVHDFIKKSEENVETLKEEERAALKEKEKVKQERITAKLRKKLLWVIGAVGVIAVVAAVIAGWQNMEAQKSKKTVQLLLYEKLTRVAYSSKLQGDYRNAIFEAKEAITYLNSIKIDIKEKLLPTKDSLENLINNDWLEIQTLIDKGIADYNLTIKNKGEKFGLDTLLISAFENFEAASKLDPEDRFLISKRERTKEMIEEKFTTWLERAERLNTFGQYEHAKNALSIANKLNINEEHTELLKNVQDKMMQK